MKSHRFRLLLPILLLLLSFTAPRALANGKKAPPPRPAREYAAFETHPDEHVTIAVDPCVRQENCEFFRLPYIRHSLIPIRVILTNDGDTALSLEEVRMQFITANHDKLPAATLDDINRRLFSTRDAAGTKIPLTSIKIHKAPVDKKITQDDQDFGFQGTTVNAHSTVAGYLFYDVKDLEDGHTSPLKDAELYVKMIRTLDGKHELFAFSIPFNKALTATPSSQPATNSPKN